MGEANLIGNSHRFKELLDLLPQLGPTQSSLLITGASGTGKECYARAIHQTSDRKDKPFVVINCASLALGLLESELFGHMKGSFTGATYDKRGYFMEADGGTVFLDEVGEISLEAQVKLLRVLQEREVRPVGSNESYSINVRIIAATHRDLPSMVEEGSFREDLFYRLNVISVEMPSLAQREEDSLILAQYFLEKFSQKFNRSLPTFSPEVLEFFKNYNWPGNVRELENTIEYVLVLCTGNEIQKVHLPARMLNKVQDELRIEGKDLKNLSYQEAKEKVLENFNRVYLKEIIKESEGNLSNASLKAGMDRSNFRKIVRKYEIEVKG